MNSFFHHFIQLFMDAAFWLLLGLLLAGLIKVWMPTRWMQTHLGKEGYQPVIKAALLGAPLPLCSCGVIPAALGIRRAGASKGATVSFLIATPETGVDSIAVTYALLGPLLAIVRPVAAICSAVAAGLGAGFKTEPPAVVNNSSSSCCSKNSCASESVEASTATEVSPSTLQRLQTAFRFGFQEVIADIALWMIAGLLFAAAVTTWLPPEIISQWGSGLPAMLAMIVISIPMYVCATASTPIAAGLLLAGISPGTVLVFMLAGPATNISTVAIIHKELGMRPLVAYLGGVICVAIVFGLGLDAMLGNGILPATTAASTNHILPESVDIVSALFLAILFIRSIVGKIVHKRKPSLAAKLQD